MKAKRHKSMTRGAEGDAGAGAAGIVTKSEGVVVGDTALGRFRLLERIGAGGFGTVYRGWDDSGSSARWQ